MTYSTKFDPAKVATLKHHFQEQANQPTSPAYLLSLLHRGRIFAYPALDVSNALNAVTLPCTVLYSWQRL